MTKPKLDDLLAASKRTRAGTAQSDNYAFRDAELNAIRKKHDLTGPDLAQIMRCEERTVREYLSGAMRMPECRWRLLMLELGLEKPYWTPSKRRKRMMAEFIGGDA